MTRKELDTLKDGDTIEFYNPITGQRKQRTFNGATMAKLYGERKTLNGGRITAKGIEPTTETRTTTTGILYGGTLYDLRLLKRC